MVGTEYSSGNVNAPRPVSYVADITNPVVVQRRPAACEA
jgi:hypothetical protein